MITRNFLVYRNGRYGWLALFLLLAAWALHATQDSAAPPSGSTWQGYVLGGLGLTLIFWLALLGIRKRSYHATGRVQAWVSAHVYLGVALVGIATLHSSGQLGWNIHSVGYCLMLIVVVSGVLGAWLYLTLPRATAENRKGKTRRELFDELVSIDEVCASHGNNCSPAIELAVQSSINGTVVGGGVIDQLFARDRSTWLDVADESDLETARTIANPDQSGILQFVARRAPRVRGDAEANALAELVSLFARRQELLRRIRKDIQLDGWLRIWLYLHVPVSIALLCAVITHILVVFLYW